MTRFSLRLDDRRFNRLAIVGMVAGFLLLVAALVAVVSSFSANQRSSELVRHTYEVVDALNLFDLQLERAESGRRGYLLSQHPYRMQVYRDNVRLAPATLERIAGLVDDNSEQTSRVAALRRLSRIHLQELQASMTLAAAGDIAAARRGFDDGSQNSAIREIRRLTNQVRDGEYALLDMRSQEVDRTLGVIRVALPLTGLLLLLVGAGTYWLMRRYAFDLARTRDRLHLLNTDLESAVAERTTDLRRANEEIQRFAYIVSHDLRSPLVNILGFTAELENTDKTLGKLLERAEAEAPELLTDEVRDAREDLPEAIGFIRSSTQKMDRLINSILKLSREGRRTLAPEPLAMQTLLTEIGHTLEHRLSEAGATLTIDPAVPDVTSDRLAVEQIFSNLLENAVKYLAPGRPGEIVVRGEKHDRRIIYEVEDNGRGIDPKDHDRIFDLFRRSGTQEQPGEGIGLAHVRALAYRLGGFIDVESSLGERTTFRLNLPATYSDQGVAN